MGEQAGLPEATRRGLTSWAERSACSLLVLFGSAARGTTRLPEDMDLAIAFRELPDPRRRLAMIGELQDLCSPARVDVVFLHRDTDPVLRFEVFRGGEALYEARPGVFADETVRALGLYEDARPFRRALERLVTGRPT